MTKDQTKAAWKVRYILETAMERTVTQPTKHHMSRVPSIKLMHELMPESSLTRCRDFVNALEDAMSLKDSENQNVY